MILDKFKLNGKIAIVTGAAKGLGRAIAEGLAEAGADICAVDILDMKETNRQIEKLGRKCVTVKADLSTKDCVAEIVDTAVKRSRLHGLMSPGPKAGLQPHPPNHRFSQKELLRKTQRIFSCQQHKFQLTLTSAPLF